MTDRFSCTRAAADEPCIGTASQVRRWILVEQPGPWGAQALRESRLDREVGARLLALGRAVGARVLLIRRHGREAEPTDGRTALLASSEFDDSWLESFRIKEPSDIFGFDWNRFARGAPMGGVPERGAYLVCTNGKHDPCCAEFGRPLAAALDRRFPSQVWESSHFGGDRFAANLVCLPEGLYYGRVEPARGAAVVRAHQRGLIVPAGWRGRSCHPFAVQAAEELVREAADEWRIDAIRLRSFKHVAGGMVDARFLVGTTEWWVRLSVEHAAPAQLTCRADHEHPAPRYELLAITRNAARKA